MTQFDVHVDASNRIKKFEHFLPGNHSHGMMILPEDVGDYLDGDERVAFGGEEYRLLPTGSLIHPDVEVPENVTLGNGVFVGRYTEFQKPTGAKDSPDDSITVAKRARIEGTKIAEGVEIGAYAIILAQAIGRLSRVGAYARLLSDVTVYDGVVIKSSAQLANRTVVQTGATIGPGVHLGVETTVAAWVEIGANVRTGKKSGAGARGYNQGGLYISQDIPPAHRPGTRRPADASA